MGVALELLMASDEDIEALVREPERAGAFVERNWSGAESEKDHETRRSMSIWKIFSEIDAVLLAGRPAGEFPFGFLFAEEHVLGRIKRTHHVGVGTDVAKWHEYEDEESFPFGPPNAFLSKRVAEIHRALELVNDEWVRDAWNPDELVAPAERERFTASVHEQRIRNCQDTVRELKAFVSRAASAGMGLILFAW